MSILLSVAMALSCIVIFCKTEPALAKMTGAVCGGVRLAFFALCLLSVVEIYVLISAVHTPTPFEAFLAAAVAVLLWCDRRSSRRNGVST